MNLGVAVDLAGRGLQDLGPASLGHAQHIDRADDRGLQRLDRIELIVARRGGTGEIVDLINFQPDRMDDVVPDQLEVWLAEQMADIGLLAREEIVEANDIMPLRNQPFAEMGAEKPGSAGHENAFESRHERARLRGRGTGDGVGRRRFEPPAASRKSRNCMV